MTPRAAAIARALLTIADVAAILNVSQRKIERMISARKIPCYRFGARTVRFKHSDVEAFIERARS